jgi:regulator of sigma E protease
VVSINDEPMVLPQDMILAGPKTEGKPAKFVFRRQDGTEYTKTITAIMDPKEKKYIFGIPQKQLQLITEIDPNSEAAKKGLQKGYYVWRFESTEEDWDKTGDHLWKKGNIRYSKSWDTPLDPKTIDKETQLAEVTVPPASSGALTYHTQYIYDEFYQSPTFGDALSMAWADTVRNSTSVFTVLRGLFTGDVSVNALSGPAGIGQLVYRAGNEPFFKYLFILGLISLNLGVLQFVPIPLLDGWHLLMVLIEKLKGSPVAPKIQEAFQYVGIFLVGGLILLATYNDIGRFFK